MTELRDLDPLTLSRQLETSAERYFAFRRAHKHNSASLHPFGGGEFPGRAHLRFIEHLPAGDPLRAQLKRWAYFLLDARLQVPWESMDADLLYRRPHGIKEPRDGRFSLAEVTGFALDGRLGPPEAWWRQRARFEGELSAHRTQMFYRREEVAERAALGDLATFTNPLSAGEGPQKLAESVLRQTQDAAESQWEGGWAAFVEAGLAREAAEGWPARLAPDTLRRLFGETQLFRGVNVQLGSLPERLNPMSFVRAAALLGRSLKRALWAEDLPFVIARDPYDLPGKRMGALFALWSMSEPFLRKQLGLSPSQVQEASRSIRRAHVCYLRLLAVRTVVREVARTKALAEEWGGISHRLCGEELPPTAALARFQVPEDSATGLVAHLSAAAWVGTLTENYDEDWYRNPRAQEEIREETRRPAFGTAALSECEEGFGLLKKQFR